MVWWDHETVSLWSQPWGMAINGLLDGTTLTQLPAEVVPWATWRTRYPLTTVLIDERDGRLRYFPQVPRENFVIGVAIRDGAAAYPYPAAARAVVVNDTVGGVPIAVIVDASTRSVDVILRRPVAMPGGPPELPDVLWFEATSDGTLRDRETGSLWDVRRALAVDGPLRGAIVRPLPYSTAFDWAWLDFYPESSVWTGG